MKRMGISEFKAKCIGVIKEARQTGTAVVITRRGEPMVRLEPIIDAGTPRQLGQLRHMMAIKGDIVRTDFADDWETG